MGKLQLGAGRMKPLAVDLFAGLGGWTEGLLAEGYFVVGFDIERHDYGTGGYPAQLVLQDVLTLHGSQFRDAALIVASPPCTEYSWMAMPWSRAKQVARALREQGAFPENYKGSRTIEQLTALFDSCFRIQREAIDAAGHFIPLVVENVRGANEWVGRSRWNFGSFHLWGDVPALMPMTKAMKNTGGSWFGIDPRGNETEPNNGRDIEGMKTIGHANIRDGHSHMWHQPNQAESDGVKQGGDWFNAEQPSLSRQYGSKSKARKAASAAIAKIPFALASHIARCWKPEANK